MWSNWSESHDRRGFLGNSAANGLFWYFKMFQFAIPLTFPLIRFDKKRALYTTAVLLKLCSTCLKYMTSTDSLVLLYCLEGKAAGWDLKRETCSLEGSNYSESQQYPILAESNSTTATGLYAVTFGENELRVYQERKTKNKVKSNVNSYQTRPYITLYICLSVTTS